MIALNPSAFQLPPYLALSNSPTNRLMWFYTTSSICQTGTQAAVSHPIYNKLPFIATRAPESRGSRMNSGIGISLLTGVMNPKISLAAQ
eukprot:scaffold3240_cov197-Alexandrium_tamarense.AAC.39